MATDHHPRSPLARPARLIACLFFAVVSTAGIGSAVAAGGWAVSTLDELPTPTAGEPTLVGFTILQHGVTPVDLAEGVGVEITLADESTKYFPAAGDGTPGHYVALVEFPAAERYSWSIHQGWFAEHELGQIYVSAPPSADRNAGSLPPVRYALLGGALVFGLVALTDVFLARRRRIALR